MSPPSPRLRRRKRGSQEIPWTQFKRFLEETEFYIEADFAPPEALLDQKREKVPTGSSTGSSTGSRQFKKGLLASKPLEKAGINYNMLDLLALSFGPSHKIMSLWELVRREFSSELLKILVFYLSACYKMGNLFEYVPFEGAL